LTNRAGT